MPKYEILPGIAGTLGLASLSTLVYRVYQTHNTTSFPYSWILLNFTAQLLSCIYGFINGATGIWPINIIFMSALLYILWVKMFSQELSPEAKKEIATLQKEVSVLEQEVVQQHEEDKAGRYVAPGQTNGALKGAPVVATKKSL